jgi:hypothetical protein
VLCGSLLTGCAGNGTPAPDDTGETRPSPLSIEYEMNSGPGEWKTGELEAGASLAFTGDGYRMTAGTWPLVSPDVDTRAVDLDPVAIDATFQPVSGTGLYGVACAVTAHDAYIFVVGVRADGLPYYGIAHLLDGVARVLRDSDSPGSTPAAQILPASGPAEVTADCRSSPQSEAALLGLTVGNIQLLTIEASQGPPTGQVGLVALSRVPGASLVVDVGAVTVRGPSSGGSTPS